jgi:hypothetical protein
MRALIREPVLHFVAIGIALFALDRAVGGGEPDERVVVVDAGVRAELADAFSHQHGREPDEDEMEELVQGWIDEEILYREGRSRGLGESDPRVRSRIAANMAFLVDAEVAIPAPGEDELRAYFEAHAAEWDEEVRVDFTQVFVAGDDESARARAEDVLDQLRGGASPNGLGDTFSGGRRYRRRTLADLEATFGADFVAGLAEQPVGSWALRRSSFGHHLVRLDALAPARAADFEHARDEVMEAWTEERRATERARGMEALRERWRVVRE